MATLTFASTKTRHGGTWVFLGRFHFEAGSDPTRGAVLLRTDSETPGATLSADVVRIGGGMGPFDRGNGVPERPMFELAARYYTQWAGAPESVYDYSDSDRSSDVGCRPRFAAWDHEDGEDAVYVAWHTNAPDPGLGTSSYTYSSLSSGTQADFEGVPGSLELQDAIHDQMIDDLRREWDEEWPNRGKRTAFFGEVNPNHNPEMPATLLEVAFHSTAQDADSLRDPRFRRIAARAIARGVATYFATRDGLDVVLAPEPPESLSMIGTEDGLVVSWDPVEGADSYVVYTSPNGRSFSEGIETSTPEVVLVPSDPLLYARVTAKNAAGESLASKLVGARGATEGPASVLVVGGFDRLDGSQLFRDDLSAYGIDTVERGYIDRINDGSHVARYGDAIAAFGASFDSADATAIARSQVSLTGYDAVFWFTGESSDSDEPLAASPRTVIARYLADGGQLFISGTELAWTLDNVQADEHSEFFQSTFGVSYVDDDAGTYQITNGTGLFEGFPSFTFDDSSEGGYDANFPDVLGVVSGEQVLGYDGVDAGAAAVYSRDLGVLFFGFPFETIGDRQVRSDLMVRVLTEFEIDPEPDPVDPPEPTESGCGCNANPTNHDNGTPLGALALLLLVLASSRARWRKPKTF